MEHRPVCFLDFDHTLFDTDRFLAERFDVASSFGVSEADWKAAYEKTLASGGYSSDRHLAELAEIGAIREEEKAELQRFIEKQTQNLASYLFADSKGFLGSLSARGIERILVTWGNPAWQEYKIRGSGIADLITGTKYVAESGVKYRVIEEFRPRGAFAFVDDNAEELDLVRDRFPRARTIHVCRYPLGDGSGFRGAERHAGYVPRHAHEKIRTLAEISRIAET